MIHFLRKLFQRFKRRCRQIVGLEVGHRARVRCRKERFGTEYGGYWICPDSIGAESIVYSFGTGNDISFDVAMIERFGLDLFAFDPTPRAVAWIKSQSLPEKFHFSEYGLADYDGAGVFRPPDNPEHVSFALSGSPIDGGAVRAEVRRLSTLLQMLGHRGIELLKMDIEGAEYDAIDDLLASDLDVGQILVEFHHRTRKETAKKKRALDALHRKGFGIFHVSDDGHVMSLIQTRRQKVWES